MNLMIITAIIGSSVYNACLPFTNKKYVATVTTVFILLSCPLHRLSTVRTFVDSVNSQYLGACNV